MDRRTQANEYDDCKGQCGYGPYCSECMKEKNRQWEDKLLERSKGQECTEEDDAL